MNGTGPKVVIIIECKKLIFGFCALYLFLFFVSLKQYVLIILFLVIAEIAAGILGFVYRDIIVSDSAQQTELPL